MDGHEMDVEWVWRNQPTEVERLERMVTGLPWMDTPFIYAIIRGPHLVVPQRVICVEAKVGEP